MRGKVGLNLEISDDASFCLVKEYFQKFYIINDELMISDIKIVRIQFNKI